MPTESALVVLRLVQTACERFHTPPLPYPRLDSSADHLSVAGLSFSVESTEVSYETKLTKTAAQYVSIYGVCPWKPLPHMSAAHSAFVFLVWTEMAGFPEKISMASGPDH